MKTNIIAKKRITVELPVCSTRIVSRRTTRRKRDDGDLTPEQYKLQDEFLDFLRHLQSYRNAHGCDSQECSFLNTDKSREAVLHFLGAIKV